LAVICDHVVGMAPEGGIAMTIAVLVPISSLPLFLLACVLVELGDYLITMVAWFLGALAVVAITFFAWGPQMGTPPFGYFFGGSILLLICAPIMGLRLRAERESREAQEEERQRDLEKQKAHERWLLRQLERELHSHLEDELEYQRLCREYELVPRSYAVT
jgi:hypothetical protein